MTRPRAVWTIVVAGWLALGARPAGAQTRNESAIVGTVRDTTGAVLRDASLTITGSALLGGPRSTTTDATGAYRFSTLPAGTYEVVASAASFTVTHRSGIVLPDAATLTVDFGLEMESVSSEIDVRAASPMVDVRSSAAETIVDQQMLQHLPTNRSVADLINLAPGVFKAPAPGAPDNVAFGGTQGSNGLVVDGINATEPELGQVRAAPNYNWIEQARTVAIGADAEYGRTTGATLDATLKSGSNKYSGLTEYRATLPSWVADNTHSPSFAPRSIGSSWDADAQLGGPIRQDRLWFFGALDYSNLADRPAGLNGLDYDTVHSPGGIGKIDAALGDAVQIDGLFSVRRRDETNLGLSISMPTSVVTYRATQTTWIGSGRLRWIGSPRTTAEVHVNGYNSPGKDGSQLPGGENGPPSHYEATTGIYSVNAPSFVRRDRHVASIGASVTHFTDSFLKGSHDLKFGVEYERTSAHDFDGYSGGRLYLDYEGAPYEVALWDGDDVRAAGNQTALYAQDGWRPAAAFTVNAGIRIDVNRGSVPGGGTVFSTTPVSPRIGVAWDVANTHRMVVRAHYGLYADPLFTNLYSFKDRAGVHTELYERVVGPGQYVEVGREDHYQAAIDRNLSPPHVAQTFLGIEREIVSDAAIEARYIDRRFEDFIGNTDTGSVWVPVSRLDPGLDNIAGTADDGQMLTVYQLTNPGQQTLLVTNPAAAYRRYDAVQIIGRKRYSQNWQLLAGYTWSRIAGTATGGGAWANAFLDRFDFAWRGPFTDPNRLVNKDVRLTSSELKVEGTYRVARFGGANLSAVFRRVSGAPVRRFVQFRGLTTGPLEPVIAKPEVTRYLDPQETLDLRAEKTFSVNRTSVGVYIDVFNVANQGIATSVVAVSDPRFGTPLTWTDPRTARAGLRWLF